MYESADPLQLVVLHFHGGGAAPRDSGGDRAPIELPTIGTALLYCREKRTLLLRCPSARLLIHGDGSLSDTEENRVAWRLGGRPTKCESRDQAKVSLARASVAFAPKLTAAVKHHSA